MGPLIYSDYGAFSNLSNRPLPDTSEVTVSRSSSETNEFHLGIKNILGISDKDEDADIKTVLQKLKHNKKDLLLPTIIRLYESGHVLCSLKDLPFPQDDRIGRSFFVLLNARFVYVETILIDRDTRGFFLKFRCVEYGDSFNITMGASDDHTSISFYHVQEIFGDKEPTCLTVFGNATCKDAEGTRFYIKPFLIFLSGHAESGFFHDMMRERKARLEASCRLISELLSSGMSPKAFCKHKGIPVERLREATSVLENAGRLDELLEP